MIIRQTMPMGELRKEFTQAHARSTDGPESHAAAASVSNIELVRKNILAILKQWGAMTDEEIASRYALGFTPKSSPSGLRSRRSELVRKGKVRKSGKSGLTAAGRSCGVWESVE